MFVIRGRPQRPVSRPPTTIQSPATPIRPSPTTFHGNDLVRLLCRILTTAKPSQHRRSGACLRPHQENEKPPKKPRLGEAACASLYLLGACKLPVPASLLLPVDKKRVVKSCAQLVIPLRRVRALGHVRAKRTRTRSARGENTCNRSSRVHVLHHSYSRSRKEDGTAATQQQKVTH